jgi:phosphinothricin acetyltransferase
MFAVTFRTATPDDAQELLAIYRPIVEATAISFETQCPSISQFAARIEAVTTTHAWLVAEKNGQIAGYAYGTPHRPRDAYRFSVETSVYVNTAHHRQGIGSQLYGTLFPILAEKGYFHAYAAIALPNVGSIAVHKSAGFRHVGTFPNVGYKFDRWHDVSWWYHCLQEGQPESR